MARQKKHYFLQINIGTLIFIAVFFYMIVSFFLYVTAKHVKSYQVMQGPLTQNETYTAIALRTESVAAANSSGYIHFYTENASKVSSGSAVYGLSDTDAVTTDSTLSIDSETLSSLRSSLSRYSSEDHNSFSDLYKLKLELSGKLTAFANRTSSANATVIRALQDGVVVYGADGYEAYTEENLTPELFDQRAADAVISIHQQVSAGDPVYKLISDENWKIAIPLTKKQEKTLSEFSTLKVKFLKDGKTQNGSLELKTIADQSYAIISFSTGMIRYAEDRFLQVELVTNTGTGLKIPNTALLQKDFYIIPAQMLFQGGNSQEKGFLRQKKDKKGNLVLDANGQPATELIIPAIYETITQKDENTQEEIPISYYVDLSDFAEGDVLQAPDSLQTYVIGETVPLDGVYCINKGYAVFRRVKILDQNIEYTLVEKQTDYGLSLYDYIAEDASAVKEDDIIHQ